MLFENNATLHKWQKTKTPPEIYKFTPTKNGDIQKWHTLRSAKKKGRAKILFTRDQAEWFLKKKFFNLLYGSD